MKRIGLFGGSFDPVHLGHLLVAQAACEELMLERLFFIPAALSPFKPMTQPAPPEARLRLLRVAMAGKSNYAVDEQEVQRGGVSFSIDTVRHYVQKFPGADLFYLIGADHVPTLPKWREADELGRLARFIVIPRPGETPVSAPSGFRVQTLGGWPLKLSSSEIRMRVKERKPVEHLLPYGVAEAIADGGLYT
jgi:nicotinate-nucleotide adenylyltransferase